MDLFIIEYWLFAFVGIVLFLGGLTYRILFQEDFIDNNIRLEQMNQQGHRTSASSRRKTTRNANKRKQQINNTNSNHRDIDDNDDEQRTILPDITTIENGERNEQQSDEEQESTMSNKQRNKNKIISSKEESIIPSKPQASVAPVKQTPPPLSTTRDYPNHLKSSQPQQDNYVKSNGHSFPSQNIYSYSNYNPLPPRFQRQRQQRETVYTNQRYRRRRGAGPQKQSSFPPDSAARQNDFVPSSARQEQEMEQYQVESSGDYVQQQELSMNNGYSSESDIVTGKIHHFRFKMRS